MTQDSRLWDTIHRNLPRRQWVPIAEIYAIVEQRVLLDDEDRVCSGIRAPVPHWHRNVRRILYQKQREGTLMSRANG